MDREMMEYLPPVLRRSRDFACLMGEYQGVFSDLWRLLWGAEEELYVTTAGEIGISRWEGLLGIAPGVGASLEVRRQVVLARTLWQTPYSWFAFLAFLTALTGDRGAFMTRLSGFRLEIALKAAWWDLKEAVWELARQVVPANIEVRLMVWLNRHRDISGRTHGALSEWTHGQIRNEVE